MLVAVKYQSGKYFDTILYDIDDVFIYMWFSITMLTLKIFGIERTSM